MRSTIRTPPLHLILLAFASAISLELPNHVFAQPDGMSRLNPRMRPAMEITDSESHGHSHGNGDHDAGHDHSDDVDEGHAGSQSISSDSEARGLAPLRAPSLASIGTVRIDVLAVGLSRSSKLATANETISKALVGRSVFNDSADQSSSSTWDIDGVFVNIRGVLIVDQAQSTSASSDLTQMMSKSTVESVATNLGVDVVAGYRPEKWINHCGYSNKLTTPVPAIVWTKAQTTAGKTCHIDGSTFAHEIGHLMDATHGKAHQVVDPLYGDLRTIMSTPSSQFRRSQFSNPQVDFVGTNVASGTALDNNASEIESHSVALSNEGTYVSQAGGRYFPLDEPQRIFDTRPPVIGGYTSVGTNSARSLHRWQACRGRPARSP